MSRKGTPGCVTVEQCEARLSRALGVVYAAREHLRRAVHAADHAEAALGDATRRLARMEGPHPAKAGAGLRIGRGGMQPTVYMRSEGK